MRELYPEVPVLVVYQRDFLALLEAHGLELTRCPPPPSLGCVADDDARTDRPRRSPLHAAHVALGAKMVPFGGWEMPLAYPARDHGRAPGLPGRRGGLRRQPSGHRAGRRARRLRPPAALAEQRPARRSRPAGRSTPISWTTTGSVADDIIVWWVDEERFDVMPNASNTSGVRGGDRRRRRHRRAGDHRRAGPPGPRTAGHGLPRGGRGAALRRHPRSTGTASRAWWPVTGYTGEDGVECAVPGGGRRGFLGRRDGQRRPPAGLGARDTLRLEAGLPLHGHELGPGHHPAPGRAGLGGGLGQGRLRRAGRARGGEGRGSGATSARLVSARAASRCETGPRSVSGRATRSAS